MNFRAFLNKIWNMCQVSVSQGDELAAFNVDPDSPFAQINGEAKYAVPDHPNQEVLKLIEYPSRPTGIQSFNEQSILSLYRDKIQTAQMLLAIGDSDIREDAFSFTNLILKPLIEYIRWVHLLPASENHHHNGIGGLFSHSLDVAILSLKNAYHSELRPIGYQDEEMQRRKVYLYAAFISGLVHDAGKIYDVDILSVNIEPSITWTPSKHSLLDWARENNIFEYEIVWRSRVHNQHNIWSGVFLERILNSVCMAYLDIVTKERVYSKMLTALNFYNDGNDYLSRCVRKADYYSTGTDLNVMRDPVMGLRSNDAAARALGSLKHNFQHLNINDFKSKPMHLIIINGEVYLNENAFLDFVLADFEKMQFNFPQGEAGKNVLTEALVQRGYIEPYSNERVVHYFIPGVFSEDDIARIFIKGIANLEFYNLLKLKWVGLVFDSYKIPDSVPGLFSINANKDFLYINEQRSLTEFRRPVPGREDVTKITDTVESLAVGLRTVNPANPDPNGEIALDTVQRDNESSDSTAVNDIWLSAVMDEDSESTIFQRESHSADDEHQSIVGKDEASALVLETDAVSEQVNAELTLQSMLQTTTVPNNFLRFVDSVPFLVVDAAKQHLPALDDTSFCREPMFQKTHRDGALTGHWIVRDVNDLRLVQLGDCCSGIHMGAQSEANSTELKSLLDTSMYQTLNIATLDLSRNDDEDDYSRDTPLPLPPERLNTHNGEDDQSDVEMDSIQELYLIGLAEIAPDREALDGDVRHRIEGSVLTADEQSDVGDTRNALLVSHESEHIQSTPTEPEKDASSIQNPSPTERPASAKPHLSPALARLFAVPTAYVAEAQSTPTSEPDVKPHDQNASANGAVNSGGDAPASDPESDGTFTLMTDGAPNHAEYELIARDLAVIVIKMKEFFNSARKNRFTLLVGNFLYITQSGIKRFEPDGVEGEESVFIKLPIYRVNCGAIKNTKCFQFDMNQLLTASDRINIDLSTLLDELLEQ
ncbi:TraI domain-containing protein [Lelliottia amnigena]|uniref:MobH family relaxase n=1 Tax=Lelliottia TaxID=1330545 RepID=UPI00192A9D5C|nr:MULTISPECIES: MobH family relaxase [Lelliottia]MBL5885599.1 TraI domain-containing protein [Lelliottia aquatilis]MBL5923171.1 TraI domain-containing protein [Lelliottia amnigena]MBL5932087.1 TraI domain-containing protein [Lelliottia amnigena]